MQNQLSWLSPHIRYFLNSSRHNCIVCCVSQTKPTYGREVCIFSEIMVAVVRCCHHDKLVAMIWFFFSLNGMI
jgi:hypothetical protein